MFRLVAQKVDDLVLGAVLSDDDSRGCCGRRQMMATGWQHLSGITRIACLSTTRWHSMRSDELGVNIHDVIEHLQERIRYYTAASDYSSSAGASVGQIYNTSQYDKVITKVEALFNPLGGADEYLSTAG